jgi:hypothetical protein
MRALSRSKNPAEGGAEVGRRARKRSRFFFKSVTLGIRAGALRQTALVVTIGCYATFRTGLTWQTVCI